MYSNMTSKWSSNAVYLGGNDRGTMACNYSLMSVCSSSYSLQIGSMLFRPVTNHPRGNHKGNFKTPHTSYNVSWEAHVQVNSLEACHTVVHPLCWDMAPGNRLQLATCRNGQLSSDIQAALALLQATTWQRTRSALTLNTSSSAARVQQSPAHAAVAGLLKVAARENTDMHFAHYVHSPFASGSCRLPAQDSDLFGVGVSGKNSYSW